MAKPRADDLEELRREVERLRVSDELKERWIALASHELRNPLTVLVSGLGVAKKQMEAGAPVDVKRLITVLDRQVHVLTRLVDDMLDVSRAEAGTISVESEPVPLHQTAKVVVPPLVESSPRHELRLDLDEVVARGDRGRVEQVISNLVRNALRYSPEGGPIRVRTGHRGNAAFFEVTDAGVGFDRAAATKLFQPFGQLKRATTREGGLGLGLYLARELITRMGGTIEGTSPGPGKGATFRFTLPLA